MRERLRGARGCLRDAVLARDAAVEERDLEKRVVDRDDTALRAVEERHDARGRKIGGTEARAGLQRLADARAGVVERGNVRLAAASRAVLLCPAEEEAAR